MIGRLLRLLGIRREIFDLTGHRGHSYAIQCVRAQNTQAKPARYRYRNLDEDLSRIQERLRRRRESVRVSRPGNVVSIGRGKA